MEETMNETKEKMLKEEEVNQPQAGFDDDDDDLILPPEQQKISRGKKIAQILLGVNPHFRHGGTGKINKTLFIASMAVVMAMGIVLNTFGFSLPGFGGHASLVLAFNYLAGMLFGPIYGFVMAILADFLGWVILPGGLYSPFIGLSNGFMAMISGFVFMLRFKNNLYKNLLILLFVFICAVTIASAYFFGPFNAGGNPIYARVATGRYTIYAPIYGYVNDVWIRIGYTPYTRYYETVRIITGHHNGTLIHEYITRYIPIGSRIYEYLYVASGYYTSAGAPIMNRIPTGSYTSGTGLHNGARVVIIALATALLVFGSWKILSIKTRDKDGKERSQWLLKLIMTAVLAFVPTTLLLTGYGLVFIGFFPNMQTAVLMRAITQPIWLGINVLTLSLIIPVLNRTIFKKHPIG